MKYILLTLLVLGLLALCICENRAYNHVPAPRAWEHIGISPQQQIQMMEADQRMIDAYDKHNR